MTYLQTPSRTLLSEIYEAVFVCAALRVGGCFLSGLQSSSSDAGSIASASVAKQRSCTDESTEVVSREDIAETGAMLIEIWNCNNIYVWLR